MDITKNWEIPLDCENCGKKFKVKFEKLNKGNKFNCPHCNLEHRVSDDGFEKVKKSMRKLQETARKIK